MSKKGEKLDIEVCIKRLEQRVAQAIEQVEALRSKLTEGEYAIHQVLGELNKLYDARDLMLKEPGERIALAARYANGPRPEAKDRDSGQRQHGRILDLVADILGKQGPSHLSLVQKELGKQGIKTSIASLETQLSRLSNQGKRFVRTAPRTYDVIQGSVN